MGPVPLAAFGAGLLVAGLFPADPGLNNVPPGSRIPPDSPTPAFRIHILAAVVVFTSLSAACVVLAHRLGGRGGPAYSRLTG